MSAARIPLSQTAKADLLLIMVTLLAAAGWMFSKQALMGLPPLLFIGIRFLLAGTVLAALGWRQLLTLDRTALTQALGLGLVFSVGMAFWILGLRYGKSVGEGAFITSLGLVMVPLIARGLFGEKLPASTWLALPISAAGMACLSLRGGLHIEAGHALYLTAAVFFALCFNLSARVLRRVPALALTALQLGMVGVLLLPLSALVETWPQQVNIAIWGWLLASALLATCLRFLLQTYAQSMASPSHVAVIMMLEPVWTAFCSAYWLDERMQPLQLLGCGLIFLALLINRWHWIRTLWKRPALAEPI